MAAWPHGDPSAVVRAILATAPYRHAPPVAMEKPKPNILEIGWTWVYEHVILPVLRAIFGRIGHSLGAASTLGTFVVYAMIAISVAGLLFAIYRLVVAFGRPSLERSSPAGKRVTLADELSSQQWRARAAEAARAGEYGRAIAALFTAALATLDERTIVAFDATRTPGEYRRLVRRARAAAAESFNDLSGRFVRAAYAEVETTAGDYAAAERAYDAFEPATA